MKCTVKLRVRDSYAECHSYEDIREQIESVVLVLKNNNEVNEIEESSELGQMVFTLVIHHHVNQIIQTFAPLCGPGSFYYILSVNSDVD